MLRLFKAAARSSAKPPLRGMSTITHDLRSSLMPKDPTATFEPSLRGKGKFASRIADYAVSPSDAITEFESLSLPRQFKIADETAMTEHPLDLAAKNERSHADIFARLRPDQVLLTNLPSDCTLTTPTEVKDYLLSKVHPDLEVA